LCNKNEGFSCYTRDKQEYSTVRKCSASSKELANRDVSTFVLVVVGIVID
jgi:hypothetical protein